jgi:drug/metabolite transporter (DMT)-like permease
VYYQSLVFLLCALYGSVFTIGKITLEFSSPLFITGARMLLAGVLLLLFQFISHRSQFYLKKAHLLPMFIIGLTNVYLANALEFWGLQYMESGKACFLYSFAPIATAVLSYFWFSEKINWIKCLGLTIGVLGFIPVLIAHSSTEDFSGKFGFLSFAELAILGAAICTAVGWMTMRVMVKHQKYSPIMANATSMCVGGVLALIHSLLVEVWLPVPVTDFSEFIGPFLLLMLISNIIAYNLNSYLLKHFTATYLSFTGLSQPIFAALFGYIFLQEVMHEYFWISMLAVILGLYIYYQQELKQGLTPRIIRKKKQTD